MNPVTLTKGTTTGAGTAIFVPDRFTTPTNISAYLVVTGAGSWSLEQTPDDVRAEGFTAASATWIRAEMSGLTGNSSAMITRCPMGMRLFMDSGTGSATLTLIQVGPGR
jgi:hypothetical protein